MNPLGWIAVIAGVVLIVAGVVFVIAFARRRNRLNTLPLEQTMVLMFLLGLGCFIVLVLDAVAAVIAVVVGG